MSVLIRILFPIFICSVLGAQAQIPQTVMKEIRNRVDFGYNPSIAVGISDSLGDHYFVYGFQDLAQKEKATVNTLYELGAITNTYTSLLFARLCSDGVINKNATLGSILPDTILPKRSGLRNITLWQLATHTSGLPKLAGNATEFNEENPFKTYDRKRLLNYLKKPVNTTSPGLYQFSNYGMALLGECMAITTGVPYEQLLKNKILSPLKLEQTFFTVPEPRRSVLALPYSGKYQVSPWDFKAYAPAGGLKSNLTDLLRYGKAYLKTPPPYKKAVAMSTSTTMEDQDGQQYGLAWFKLPEGALLHGGGTGGFRTFLAIDTVRKRVITILTNSGSAPAEDLLFHLLNPKKYPVQKFPRPLSPQKTQLNALKGLYLNDGFALEMKIVILQENPFVKLQGQLPVPLYFRGENQYSVGLSQTLLEFEQNDKQQIVGVKMIQNGQSMTFIKTNSL